MRAFRLAPVLSLSLSSLLSSALSFPSLAAEAPATDPAAPLGKLSDAAKPTAYRIDMTILPDQPRFSGHDEIDAVLKAPTKRLYLHGNDLNVSKAVAMVGGKPTIATWTQVDKTGVVRLDFESELPAGPVTLVFDFDGAFGNTPVGLYRTKVGDQWYSWSQFESIDARRTFPSFDEPGFKTPFNLSITTRAGLKAVSNTPELSVSPVAAADRVAAAVAPMSASASASASALAASSGSAAGPGGFEKHVFAQTKPLPTYLVAMVTGPFNRVTGEIPPNAMRSKPLPLGAVATQVQGAKMGFVMAETPRIVGLLEAYFGGPFPFEKLDQIASPTMPGAMENAGADIYADGLILLDAGASTRQKQGFGAVVSHELSHQWFGDLVTPAWWDDLWLNESFANWMGYRIGGEWRPELNIGIGGITGGFAAMNTDSLEVGRPIHQPIKTNSEIDSAFDSITYGKGGHVITMIAAYLGDDKFREGVRLHMARHRYGNADSEQFFASLADAAKEPRVLTAMKSFVDQSGVPVIDFTRKGDQLVATQSRYAFLGSKPAARHWTIPLCLRTGGTGTSGSAATDAGTSTGTGRSCTLLDAKSETIAAPAGVLMPNAGGTGYYRFNLQPADWQALIKQGATLSPAEAIAFDDSLWAAFRAGKAQASWLIEAAKSMAANPDSNAAVDGGERLAGLRTRGLIDPASEPAYRKLMISIYAPKLTAMGFDPAAGAHAGDSPDKQALRQSLLGLVAREGRDPTVRAKLVTAAEAYLAGNAEALDQGLLYVGLSTLVNEQGVPAAKVVMTKALASEDAIFRRAALGAVASSGRPDVAHWVLDVNDDRLRLIERAQLIFGLTFTAGTQDLGGEWLLAHYDKLTAGNGVFLTSRIPQAFAVQCGTERAQRLNDTLGPKVRALNAGVLDFERTVETVRDCGVLKTAKAGEIAQAIAKAK